MNVDFLVLTTSRFDRELKKLVAHHPELPEHYRQIVVALKVDPYNDSRRYLIKKLQGVQAGGGQYRIPTPDEPAQVTPAAYPVAAPAARNWR
jgi:hypothetical protein